MFDENNKLKNWEVNSSECFGKKKMEEELRNKIERNKIKAERFKKNNQRAFIIDMDDTYYFCYIIFVGEEGIHLENFEGVRKGEKSRIFWEDILRIKEYKERV